MRALVLVAVMMIPTLAVCGFGGDAGAAGLQAIRRIERKVVFKKVQEATAVYDRLHRIQDCHRLFRNVEL